MLLTLGVVIAIIVTQGYSVNCIVEYNAQFNVKIVTYLSNHTSPNIVSNLGNGTAFTASFMRPVLSWPGNRRQVVIPEMALLIKKLRSANRGADIPKPLVQEEYKAFGA